MSQSKTKLAMLAARVSELETEVRRRDHAIEHVSSIERANAALGDVISAQRRTIVDAENMLKTRRERDQYVAYEIAKLLTSITGDKQ